MIWLVRLLLTWKTGSYLVFVRLVACLRLIAREYCLHRRLISPLWEKLLISSFLFKKKLLGNQLNLNIYFRKRCYTLDYLWWLPLLGDKDSKLTMMHKRFCLWCDWRDNQLIILIPIKHAERPYINSVYLYVRNGHDRKFAWPASFADCVVGLVQISGVTRKRLVKSWSTGVSWTA